MIRRYKPDSNTCITEYGSLSEFISDINSLPLNTYMSKYFTPDSVSSKKKESAGGDWYQTEDYDHATRLLTQGWQTASEKMTQKIKATSGIQSTVRTSRPTYGVIGSQASVPRYLQGIPTNMVSRQMVYSKQKVVTITKGISYSAMWSAESILRESVKALQLVQSLESNGQRVRLNVMLASSSSSKHSICKVCIKQPDERLNISKMSFALAHPSMLRRFFFRWIEVDPFIDFDLGFGYGTPSTLNIKEKAMAENEYYIPEKIENVEDTLIKIQTNS